MRYMLLIHAEENEPAPGEDRSAMMEGYRVLNEELHAAGAWCAGDRLQPTTTATVVRVRDGKALITDGPFIETREQLAGFYLIQCENLDEALGYAQKIPGAAAGSVEVRPIWEFAAQ